MQETQEMQVQSLGQEDSPGGGNDNRLQHACLKNPMDRGLGGLQSWGCKELDMTKRMHTKPRLK